MTGLAPFVAAVGRGPGRGRSLTQDEACTAMELILSGHADPVAVGALLMVLRFRGETDTEIAGFTAALRNVSPVVKPADLDWPCYAAGRSRGAPLFLLAAKLVAQAGYRVVMHGWNSHQSAGADVRAMLGPLGIPTGGAGRLVYLPLEDVHPAAFDVLKLRDVLGLRSCFNTVVRMWNPSGARASVQGVFHPSYRGLQARAAALLGDTDLTIIKGGGGEFERHPSKDIQVFGLRNGVHHEGVAPALVGDVRRLNDGAVDVLALWQGRVDDAFATATVTGTAALALWTLGAATTISGAQDIAAQLWQNRQARVAA